MWIDGEAILELESSEKGYTIQYKLNVTEGDCQEYKGPITGLHHEDKVYARIWDGTNGSGHTAITITDGVAPIVTVTKGTVTTSSIQVSVNAEDEQSGMPSNPIYNYYIKESTDSDYPDKTVPDTRFLSRQENRRHVHPLPLLLP